MPMHILTKDPLPFMILAFGMAAGVTLLIALLIGFSAFGSLRSLSRGAPAMATRCDTSIPPVCTQYDVRQDAMRRIIIAVLLLVAVVGVWCIGVRDRIVTLEGDTVRVTWGAWLPVTLRTVPADDLASFTITKEARFAVSPIPGTSVQGVRSRPDRWRLKATANGKTVNLGSYASEKEAEAARSAIMAAGK